MKRFSPFVVLLFLVGCGIGDKEEKQQVVTATYSSCTDHSPILKVGENAQLHFNLAPGMPLTPSLDVGGSLTYFDWGTVTQVDSTTVNYTAPAFIPEPRRLAIESTNTMGAPQNSSCYVYLLDDFTYGTIDDSTMARGLIAASYIGAAADLARIANLTPKEKGVVRDLNFTNVPAMFTGVSTLPAPFLIRMTGTLTTQAATYWFRFTSSTANAKFYIDGLGPFTGAGGTGAELPTGTLPTSPVPNYNTGFSLTAGKHNIVIEFQYAQGNNYKLEWTTTKPTTTVKNYTVIPYTAFDRD